MIDEDSVSEIDDAQYKLEQLLRTAIEHFVATAESPQQFAENAAQSARHLFTALAWWHYLAGRRQTGQPYKKPEGDE
jgi:hypothetical protein